MESAESYGQKPSDFLNAVARAIVLGNTTYDCYWDGVLVDRSGFVGATPATARLEMLSRLSDNLEKSGVAYMHAQGLRWVLSPIAARKYSLKFGGLRYNKGKVKFWIELTTLELLAYARARNAASRAAALKR